MWGGFSGSHFTLIYAHFRVSICTVPDEQCEGPVVSASQRVQVHQVPGG
jgi:hypothetical protein